MQTLEFNVPIRHVHAGYLEAVCTSQHYRMWMYVKIVMMNIHHTMSMETTSKTPYKYNAKQVSQAHFDELEYSMQCLEEYDPSTRCRM